MTTSNKQQVQPSGDRASLELPAESSNKNKTTKQFYKTLFGDSSHQGAVFEITVTEKNKQQKQEYCIYIHEVSSTFYDAAVVFLTGEDKDKKIIYKSFAAFRYTEIILKFIRKPTIEEQNSLPPILSGTQQQRQDDDSGASARSKEKKKNNNTKSSKIPKQKSYVPPISEIRESQRSATTTSGSRTTTLGLLDSPRIATPSTSPPTPRSIQSAPRLALRHPSKSEKNCPTVRSSASRRKSSAKVGPTTPPAPLKESLFSKGSRRPLRSSPSFVVTPRVSPSAVAKTSTPTPASPSSSSPTASACSRCLRRAPAARSTSSASPSGTPSPTSSRSPIAPSTSPTSSRTVAPSATITPTNSPKRRQRNLRCLCTRSHYTPTSRASTMARCQSDNPSPKLLSISLKNRQTPASPSILDCRIDQQRQLASSISSPQE
jgi:hypothetical protein